jgi:Domain of unknown function (DUF3597)
MSVLGSIVSKIFHTEIASAMGAPHAAPDAAPAAGAAPPAATAAGGQTGAAAAAAVAAPRVDVAAVLDGLAGHAGETLDWRHSIVDLMKLLDLDSSLPARKRLAEELHYSGSTSDSAAMNVWLHKEVMTKLAENGGKVPEELKG